MRAEPELVAGEGRLDTRAMLLDGVVAKGGARGIVCCGCAVTGLGGALKVEDGDALAAELAGSVLVELVAGQAVDELRRLRERPLCDGADRPIGSFRVDVSL
jgi:L-asparaginase II